VHALERAPAGVFECVAGRVRRHVCDPCLSPFLSSLLPCALVRARFFVLAANARPSFSGTALAPLPRTAAPVSEARGTERRKTHRFRVGRGLIWSPRAPSGAPSRRFSAAGAALFVGGSVLHSQSAPPSVSEPVAGGRSASGRVPGAAREPCVRGTGRGRRILLRLRTPPETPS
jgi:hypothetical protein